MFNDQLNLPPVGMISPDDVGRVMGQINLLMQESRQARNQHIERAETNANVRKFGQATEPTSREVVSNHILDDIDVITDQQTKEPAVVTYECADDGREPMFFLKSQATPPLTAQQAQAMTMEGVAADGMTPLPAMWQPQDLVRVDAKIVSQFYQKQCDHRWAQGLMDQRIALTIFKANTLGFQFPIFEWNFAKHQPRLWQDISLTQVFPDPVPEMFADVNHFILEWARDAREAEAMFTQFADAIEEVSQRGQPQRIDGNTELSSGPNLGADMSQNFNRPMVILRVAWLKNQPCPMTVEEAQAAGLVEYRPAQPAPLPAADYATDGANVLGGDHADVQRSDSIVPGIPQGTGAGDDGDPIGPPGMPGGDGVGAPADPSSNDRYNGFGNVGVPAQALFHTATNAPLDAPARDAAGGHTVTHPAWPMKLVTRQLIIISGQPNQSGKDRIVQDIECPYWDIPVAHTVGIRNLNELYGMGIPQKLESMQKGRNQAITAVVEHSRYYRFPVVTGMQSVKGALDDKFKKFGHSLVGQMIWLRDELWARAKGEVVKFIFPPPMSESTLKVIDLLGTELDSRSAHPQVLEGTPPQGVTGHQSIELLQNAASSKFGFAAQGHRNMIQRIAELHRHAVVTFVPTQELMRVDKSLPPWAVDAVRQWGKEACWDVEVQDLSGTSTTKRQKQQDAFTKFQVRDPQTGEPVISMKTLRDRTGEDNDREREAWEQDRNAAMQQQAQAAQMQQAATGQEPGEPPEKKPGKNGDGAAKKDGNGRMTGAAQ